MGEKILWQPAKFFKFFAGLILLFFSLLFLFIPGAFDYIIIEFLVVSLSFLMFYFAISIMFTKSIKITEHGVFLGGMYSNKKIGYFRFATIVFVSLFRKSKFVSWGDIKEIQLKELRYFVPSRNIPYFIFQKFLIVKNNNGETFWVLFDYDGERYRKEIIDLDVLLSSKGKKVVKGLNKKRGNFLWNIIIIAVIITILLFTVYIMQSNQEKELLFQESVLICNTRCIDKSDNYQMIFNQSCFEECVRKEGVIP